MVVNGNGSSVQLEGVVARTNDRGLLLEGREGWLNVSKFATDVVIPEPGSHVRVTVDPAERFVRKIEVLALAQPLRPGLEPGVAPDRDHRILRQAVLNTATAMLSSGGRPTDLPAVLEVATALEYWVLRDGDSPRAPEAALAC